MVTQYLTLADYAAEPKPLVAGVAKKLQEESKFMDILRFADTGSISVKSVREGSMPDVSWRNIGESHGSSKATKPDEVTEVGYSIGNEIKVDKAYMKDKSARLYNPMTYNTNMVIKSISRNFNDKCINGLPSDKKNPVGLYHRVMNDLGSSQRISGGIDISADAPGLASNIQTFIDALDALIYSVAGSLSGMPGMYFLCNDTIINRVNSCFRQSNLLDTTKDSLGREFKTYKNIPFIDMGFKYDDTTKIVGDVELANGTALTGGLATSIYCVRIGDEYFTGWQEYALDVSEPELMDDKVTFKSVIDWFVGIAITHPRSVSRLYGITAK